VGRRWGRVASVKTALPDCGCCKVGVELSLMH
jgi:hypothetical protein